MIVEKCLICGLSPASNNSAIEFLAHGVRAPWISELADEQNSTDCSLWACGDCDFNWFSPRMTEEVEGSLYSGYRENRYYSTRRKWEPWYFKVSNNSRNPGTKAARLAVSTLDSLLRDLPDSIFEIVADVGGDAGQFFPSRSQKRLLVDPSNKPAVSGVLRAQSIAELPSDTRLVRIGCVLPHVANPKSLLMEIRKNCPQALIVITMANDRYRLRNFHKSKSYLNFVNIVIKRRHAFIILDFATGICRQFNRKIPRFGIIKQSEHVNYYSLHALSVLAKTLDFKVLKQSENLSGGFGGMRIGELMVVLEPTPGVSS
jgi:hypothetical protein